MFASASESDALNLRLEFLVVLAIVIARCDGEGPPDLNCSLSSLWSRSSGGMIRDT